MIAGIVLETTLRDRCERAGLQPGSLNKMNADLARAGRYNLLTQKKITALADIRNSAAHGDVGGFQTEDVRAMLADVERFVEQHLGQGNP